MHFHVLHIYVYTAGLQSYIPNDLINGLKGTIVIELCIIVQIEFVTGDVLNPMPLGYFHHNEPMGCAKGPTLCCFYIIDHRQTILYVIVGLLIICGYILVCITCD